MENASAARAHVPMGNAMGMLRRNVISYPMPPHGTYGERVASGPLGVGRHHVNGVVRVRFCWYIHTAGFKKTLVPAILTAPKRGSHLVPDRLHPWELSLLRWLTVVAHTRAYP